MGVTLNFICLTVTVKSLRTIMPVNALVISRLTTLWSLTVLNLIVFFIKYVKDLWANTEYLALTKVSIQRL